MVLQLVNLFHLLLAALLTHTIHIILFSDHTCVHSIIVDWLESSHKNIQALTCRFIRNICSARFSLLGDTISNQRDLELVVLSDY